MRTLSLLVLVFFVNQALYAQETKVLFFGNSYTYVNDLPQKLKDLALSTGDVIVTDQNTPGGYRFMQHSANATTYTKINSQDWDFVVLQAQSQEPSWPVGQITSEVFPHAKQICDSVKAHDACTEVLFFSTWGRENGDAQNCASWPPVCTFVGMNDRLTVAYYTMAEQNEASVSPVGMAWKVAREDGLFNSINLYTGDGSHPSVHGTYLSACVFYQAILKKPVENADFYGGLPEDEALYLQSVANSVFELDFEYALDDAAVTGNEYTFTRDSWFEFGHSVFTDFEFTPNEIVVQFTDLSVNGVDYSWDFGDGNTSTEVSPLHTYTNAGQHSVTLIASNSCFLDSSVQILDIPMLIEPVEIGHDIKVFAVDNEIRFYNVSDITSIQVYSLEGKAISQLELNNQDEASYSITNDTTAVVVRLTDKNGQSFSRKIVL